MQKARKTEIKLSSIRYRIIMIYLLLVFITMAILGVFIMRELESYNMSMVRENFTKTVENGLLNSFTQYEKLEDNKIEIQINIETWGKNIQEELFVVTNDFNIMASNNVSLIDKNAVGLLDENVIVRAMQGVISESDTFVNSTIPVKNMVFPIVKSDGFDDNMVTGVFYLRADMTSAFNTINQAKSIFIRAVFIALIITAILGYLIAGSITIPINVLTKKAEQMARGDFTQKAEVKSDDEIGRLAEMFNLMQKRLSNTLSQMIADKSKLEAILTYMADGLVAVDLEGNIVHANDAAIHMLNMDRKKIDYMAYYDAVIEKFSSELTVSAIREKKEISEGELLVNYRSFIYRMRYGKFVDENNQDVGIILMIQDITQRQKYENMQADFVANVSHELKTPLTTIKSYTETILESFIVDEKIEDTTTVKSFLKIVDKEADRMGRLVKDLLQLSRLDYNSESFEMKETDIIGVLLEAIVKIEINAVNKVQQLNVIFDKEQEIFVYIDCDRMEQVIVNILSNAIKYTQEKGRIDVDVIILNEEVHIMIRDNGIGIPEGDQTRLFERFYRVDKARSRQMGGTGLGLAIAKQIVDAHEGKISIDSKENRGTLVTIALPIHL